MPSPITSIKFSERTLYSKGGPSRPQSRLDHSAAGRRLRRNINSTKGFQKAYKATGMGVGMRVGGVRNAAKRQVKLRPRQLLKEGCPAGRGRGPLLIK